MTSLLRKYIFIEQCSKLYFYLFLVGLFPLYVLFNNIILWSGSGNFNIVLFGLRCTPKDSVSIPIISLFQILFISLKTCCYVFFYWLLKKKLFFPKYILISFLWFDIVSVVTDLFSLYINAFFYSNFPIIDLIHHVIGMQSFVIVIFTIGIMLVAYLLVHILEIKKETLTSIIWGSISFLVILVLFIVIRELI